MQGRSVVTIVLFILSIIFVIHPVKIPFGRSKNNQIPLNLLTAPILAIAILWASKCLVGTTIRDGIVGTDGIKPYNILILFFSLAYMSITLDVTGVLEAAAHWVSNASGENGLRLYINFYLMVTALSAILGNDPVILTGTLFLLYYTKVTELNSKPWLMSEFAAANTASMILFVGNPTNVVICEGFGIQNAVFTAYTILPFVACSATCIVALILQFKTTGLKLKKVDAADPRSFIKDPAGAVVGSILLGGCLITALVVSFLNVDVWKITLPFACAKLFFDIVRDLYRTRTGATKPEPVMNGHHPDMDTANVRTDSLPNSIASGSDQTVVDDAPTKQKQATKSRFAPLGNMSKTCKELLEWTEHRQPTLFVAFPRLPFALVPFAFSQFILIEALARQGWISTFAHWLDVASGNKMFPTIWIVGVMGIILCNIAGTNIGATILLTKVVRAASLSPENTRAAGVALALASNIGAVSFVFSASLAGLLWKQIIEDYDNRGDDNRKDKQVQEGGKRLNRITQREFAKWNLIPLMVMTAVGLGVVSAEMALLYRRHT